MRDFMAFPDLRTLEQCDSVNMAFLKGALEKTDLSARDQAFLKDRYVARLNEHGLWYSGRDEVPGYRMVRILRSEPGRGHFCAVTCEGAFLHHRFMTSETGLFRDFCRAALSGNIGILDDEGDASLSVFSSWHRGQEKSLHFGRIAVRPSEDKKRKAWNRRFSGKDAVFGKLHGILYGRTRRALHYSTRCLLDALEPEVVSALRRTGRMRMEDAVWFTGARDKGEGVSAMVSLRRCQAGMIYPTLLTEMKRPAVTAVIDAAQELVPVLAREAGLSEPIVRRLHDVSWQRAAIRPAAPDIRFLQNLPEQHFPHARKDFITLRRASENLRQVHNLKRFGLSDARGISPDRVQEIFSRTDAGYVRDFLHHLHDRLVLPLMMRKALSEGRDVLSNPCPPRMMEVSRALWSAHALGHFGLPRIADGSIAWHRGIGEFSRSSHLGDLAWSPLIGVVDQGGGVILREICSDIDLFWQGKSQHHCVGDYTGRVSSFNGKNHATVILSIERGGEIFSTAELRIARHSKAVSVAVVQNRASHNSAPPPWTHHHLEEIRKNPDFFGITSESLDAYARGMDLWRVESHRQNRACPARMLCGFIPTEDDTMRITWERMSRFLPRGVRKASMEAFAERLPDNLWPSLQVGEEILDQEDGGLPF